MCKNQLNSVQLPCKVTLYEQTSSFVDDQLTDCAVCDSARSILVLFRLVPACMSVLLPSWDRGTCTIAESRAAKSNEIHHFAMDK